MNNILHIYGQYEEHDDIEIAGDRQALIELRAAIDMALDTKNGESEPYTNDGEDYTIRIDADDERLNLSRNVWIRYAIIRELDRN